VAGACKMDYFKFFLYNILGAIVWTKIFIASGYLFGNLPFVQNNFSLVVFFIIVVSLIPIVREFIKTLNTGNRNILPREIYYPIKSYDL
jgi:membrane-associated protein